MRDARLVAHQFRYELVEFAQNAQSRFFTLALPVILLLILVSILGSHHTLGHTGIATLKIYYHPAMLAFGVVWASVINLAVNLTVAREESQPATLVEFPAYSARLEEVERVVKAYGFDPSAIQVTSMLDEIHSESAFEPAPAGADYLARCLVKHRAASVQ